jgi:hypothetical protein
MYYVRTGSPNAMKQPTAYPMASGARGAAKKFLESFSQSARKYDAGAVDQIAEHLRDLKTIPESEWIRSSATEPIVFSASLMGMRIRVEMWKDGR